MIFVSIIDFVLLISVSFQQRDRCSNVLDDEYADIYYIVVNVDIDLGCDVEGVKFDAYCMR